MQTRQRYVCVATLALVGSMLTNGVVLAQQVVNPRDLGIVAAPTAGSTPLPLGLVPLEIIHAAEVAFKRFEGGATLTSAQLDKDDVLAIYEIRGATRSGTLLEADIRPDGTVEELEIEIQASAVPAVVREALEQFAPSFTPDTGRPLIEMSVRPSDAGLSEIWYEYSGTQFDVEIRSDGKALLIEPA